MQKVPHRFGIPLILSDKIHIFEPKLACLGKQKSRAGLFCIMGRAIDAGVDFAPARAAGRRLTCGRV